MRSVVRRTALAAVAAVALYGQALAGTLNGTVTLKGAPSITDVVIHVDAVPGAEFKAPEEPAVINQEHMSFVPHVLPVMAGTTVEFHNGDDVLHNVFTPMKCAGQFNLGTWGKGQKRSYTFTEPGCQAVLLCSVHPEMEGYVVTLPTPYFATADDKGNYTIDGVPAGTYTVEVWHPTLKKATPKSAQVTVPAEGAVRADFALRK